MARDPDSLTIEKWATTGDVRTPEDRGLNEAVGWPADFSQVGGRRPTRELFNWLFRVLTAMAVELNSHGLLEWSNQVDYQHPAAVLASDGMVYLSKLASGPNQGGAIDPTGSQGSTRWRPVADPVQDASTSVKGQVELATAAEVVAGTDTQRAVTSAGLAARTPNASTTVKGQVELATAAEAVAGTDTQRAVTSAGLAARTPNASTTVKGQVELATAAEAVAGTDTQRAVTSAGLAARTPNASTTVKGQVELATAAEAVAGTDTQRAVTSAGLAARTPNASTTVKGQVELATAAEAVAGTDASRALTPAGARSAGDGRYARQNYAWDAEVTSLETFFTFLDGIVPSVGNRGVLVGGLLKSGVTLRFSLIGVSLWRESTTKIVIYGSSFQGNVSSTVTFWVTSSTLKSRPSQTRSGVQTTRGFSAAYDLLAFQIVF